tara:strand:- start:913 stop:4839 length:3927 start_codon:yes stop_codon:yes gene_type:complete
MAKPSLDDLIGSVRDPKKQARKDALANVPVNKTSAAQAAANRSQKFVDKAKTALEKGQKADSLAAKQNRRARVQALKKRATQLKQERKAGQQRLSDVKSSLQKAGTPVAKVASGSNMKGDAGGYGSFGANMMNTVGNMGKAVGQATGVGDKLKGAIGKKAKVVGQRMFSKSKNRGLSTGVASGKTLNTSKQKKPSKVSDPWKDNKPKDPWKEEYLWEVDKKKEESIKIIKPMSGKNIIKINPDIKEEAVSKKQQRFMGMVRAAQKGECASSPEVAKVAASMKKKDVKDFASTKHKGLPEKKVSKEAFEIDNKKHRQAQRGTKIRNLIKKGATEGERNAAKSKAKGPALFGEEELKEYSPNVTYQDKKKGKLGKSSLYSIKDKSESKKDFRKSYVKDVEDGYVGKGHKPTKGSIKKLPEGFSTVEDMHGNVMAHVVDFTAQEIIEDQAKKCPDGKYWCYTDKKCKTIPRGWHVGRAGYIEKDEDDDSKQKEGNGNGNGNGGNGNGGNGNGGGSVSEGNKSGDNSLRDWFGKSRSSDGTPGWVQLGGKYAGKPCAKQPGQTTKPKCGSSKMKRNLNKDEEEAAFRRKNKKDPNPDRKGKAINVKTEETMKESHVPGKPAEKLKTDRNMFQIPQSEKDAARQRLIAKAKAKVMKKKNVSEGLATGALTYKKSKNPGRFEKAGRVAGGIAGGIAGGAAAGGSTLGAGAIAGGIAGDIVGTRAGGDLGKKIDKLTTKKKKVKEGKDYGITRGDGKPKGPMSNFGKNVVSPANPRTKSKENPYSLKNKLKMVVRSIAEKERMKAGVTKEELQVEGKKPFPTEKVDKKLSSLRDKMKSKPYGFKRSDEKNRSMKISGIKDAVKRGEDPRSDTRGGAYAKRGNPPEDHRKHFTKTPLKNRPVKPAGVRKEELELDEAKVDKGRSDYGKASIRNYRRMGPGHGDPGMFDPEGKRGKTIDKRREEHKARRGVKGAKVPAYKVEEVDHDLEEGWGKAITAGGKALAKKAVRQGIKVGGKTGGKVVKAVIKHGGDELKQQAVQTAAEVSTNAAKKLGQKTREKANKALDVKEAAGEKDACYKKVKATAKVWPSAYASGRLVQCRKKGAANWGNKKEEVENNTFERIMEKCWKGYSDGGRLKKKGNRMVPDCRKIKEETVEEGRIVRAVIKAIDKTNPPIMNSKRRKIVDALRRKEISDTVKKNAKKSFSDKAAKPKKISPVNFMQDEEVHYEGAAWTKKSGKSASGGLNEKGRKSYERENPGSDLKAPVTGNPKKGSKAEGRQNSFCKRMKGMKAKLTSAKTARDPDSRINKSLRKWNCK